MGLNAWQPKLWHRVESPWNSLFLASSESECVNLYSSLFTRARNTELFAQLICSPDGWNLLGPKEKSGLELPWEVFEPQDCRKTSVQQQGAATIHSSRYTARMPRKSGEIFFWLPGQYYSEHILLMDIVDIMELWPNFLFQLQLSVGGEKLASQVVCSWNPTRQDNIWTR